MLYHFSEIDYKSFLLNYSTLFNPKDIIVFDRSVIGRIELIKETNNYSNTIAQLCLYSKQSGTILIVATRLIIDSLFYNSVFIIAEGNLLGISDEINPMKGYEKGKSLDYYDFSNKRIQIIIGNDILYSSINVENEKYNPDYIFHIDFENFNAVKSKKAANLSIYKNSRVYSLFFDSAIAYDNTGSISQIEIGKMRRFNTLSGYQYNLLLNKEKFVLHK